MQGFRLFNSSINMVVTVTDINVLKAIENFSTNTEIEPALHQAYHALCIYTHTHIYHGNNLGRYRRMSHRYIESTGQRDTVRGSGVIYLLDDVEMSPLEEFVRKSSVDISFSS